MAGKYECLPNAKKGNYLEVILFFLQAEIASPLVNKGRSDGSHFAAGVKSVNRSVNVFLN